MTNSLNPLYYETWFECSSSKLPEQFVIITAHNPRGTTVSDDVNDELDLKLIRHLNSLGLSHAAVAAGSKDRKHIEASYAVGCELATGIELCNEYEQDAIFWVENGKLNIVGKKGTPNDFIDFWSNRLLP